VFIARELSGLGCVPGRVDWLGGGPSHGQKRSFFTLVALGPATLRFVLALFPVWFEVFPVCFLVIFLCFQQLPRFVLANNIFLVSQWSHSLVPGEGNVFSLGAP